MVQGGIAVGVGLGTVALWEGMLGNRRVSNPVSRAHVALQGKRELSDLPQAVLEASDESYFVQRFGTETPTPEALAELCLLAVNSPAVLHLTVSAS